MRRSLGFMTLVASAVTACSHPHAPATVATPTAPARAAEPPVAATPVARPTPASPNLAVSGELGKRCALHFHERHEAPRFDFDHFELLPEDRDVLDQVATCLTSGALKGKKLELVGRADPRGTEEYNLALGDRRATSVGDYLKRLGVAATQVATTTRGALDASGRDEATWRVDRRVDLELQD